MQLATGDQPYRGLQSPLWESFCAGVGDLHIEASEVTGASLIEWDLSPRLWPSTPEQPSDAWDGFKITIDGKSASLSAAREVVAVERLDGSETVRDTIVRRIRDEAARLASGAAPLLERTEGYIEVLSGLRTATGVASRGEYETALKASAMAAQRRKELQERAERLEAMATDLREAATLHSLLERRGEEDLAGERERIDAELANLQEDYRGVSDALQERASQAPSDTALKSRQSSVRRATTRLRNLERDGSDLAERAEIEPDQTAVAEQLAHLRAEQQELQRRRRALGDLPASRDVGVKIQRALTSEKGLDGDAVIAVIGEDDLTSGALSEGIDRYRARSSRLVEEDLDALDARTADVAGRIFTLNTLATALERIPAAEEALRAARYRLQEAVEQLENRDARHQIADLIGRQQELVEAIGRLNRRRGVVVATESQMHRHGSPDDVKERIAALLERHDASLPTLGPRLAEVEDELSQVQTSWDEASRAASSAEEELRDIRQRVRSAVRRLHSDRLMWSREAIERVGLHAVPRDEMPIGPLSGLDRAAQRVDQALDRVRQIIAGTSAAAETLAVAVERNTWSADPTDLAAGVRRFFEADVAERFREMHISEELFDGAHSVRFDLARMEVILADDGGTERARPLEAFSSGERAFAYTLQRIHQPVRNAENRLLVLDEFGAYMEADKLAKLEQTLATRVPGATADQLVVILPLRPGSKGPRKNSDLPTLEADGYFVVPLEG
jgi:hypothetical protein